MTMSSSMPMQSYLLALFALALSQSDVSHASSFSKPRHASFIVPKTSPSPSLSSLTVSKRRITPSHHLRLRCRHFVDSSRCHNHRSSSQLPLQTNDESETSSSDTKAPSNTNQSSFVKYGRPQDITSESFGPLLPIAEALDEATGGWGLSYADLHPATPRTTVGRVFLATNFFYAAAGLWLGIQGDWFYGGLTELAGIVSFAYHYTQLEFGKNRSEVRLALLIDYFCAGSALLTGGVYMVQAGITSVPIESLVSAGVAVVCLSLCWVWEFGYPYIFWHSLWHISSAYTGYLVGQDHLSRIAGQ